MKTRAGITQTRPFQATIAKWYQHDLRALAKSLGVEYGIFFSTSGKCLAERINPTAQHDYVFRTDR